MRSSPVESVTLTVSGDQVHLLRQAIQAKCEILQNLCGHADYSPGGRMHDHRWLLEHDLTVLTSLARELGSTW